MHTHHTHTHTLISHYHHTIREREKERERERVHKCRENCQHNRESTDIPFKINNLFSKAVDDIINNFIIQNKTTRKLD